MSIQSTKSAVLKAILLGVITLAPAISFAAGSDDQSSDDGVTETIEQRKVNEAAKLVYKEKYREAIRSLQRTVKRYPKNADAWNLLGFSMRKTGDTDGASEAYSTALSIDENHLGALEYQGELFIMLGQMDKAKQNLDRLKDLCPDGCDELTELVTAIDNAS